MKKGKFSNPSNVGKIIAGAVLTIAGFYLSGWVKPVFIYRVSCADSVCNDLFAGPIIFISGVTIILYTFLKGLVFGIINIIRAKQGKDIVRE